MNKRTIVRYSEAFKISVVKDYEESYLTHQEIKKKYGIKGSETFTLWLRKYGKPTSSNTIIRVEKKGEKDRLKALEKENQKLKEALSYATLKSITSESMVEAIAEMLGMSVEDLKKKFGEQQ